MLSLQTGKEILFQMKRLVHTSDANTNTNASTSKHTCECKRNCQRKKWKFFLFLLHVFTLAFHTLEPGRRTSKRKREMKNTRSLPPRFKFKPRWRPPR